MSPTNAPRRHVVGSASIWVLGQVAGPPRKATVLHAGPDAIYLDLEGTCLGVLGARAVQVPCGVRTMLPRLPDCRADAEAVVVDGSVEVADLDVLVTHIVDTTVPVLWDEGADWGARVLAELVGGRLDGAREQLPAEALRALSAGEEAAVGPLVGLGPGLTPLGDDVVSGWLAAAVACRRPDLDPVRAAVALSADRTTMLSATLLQCAARGEGLPEFRMLLSGMASRNADIVAQALDLLLDVGDTSGAGLVLGAQLALPGPTDPDPPPQGDEA